MYRVQGEHIDTPKHSSTPGAPFPAFIDIRSGKGSLTASPDAPLRIQKGAGNAHPKVGLWRPTDTAPPSMPSFLPAPPPPRQSPPHGSPALEPFRQLSRWRQLSEPLCQLSRYRQLLEPLRQLWRWARKWTRSWRWSHRCHWSHLVAGRRRVHRVSVA